MLLRQFFFPCAEAGGWSSVARISLPFVCEGFVWRLFFCCIPEGEGEYARTLRLLTVPQ